MRISLVVICMLFMQGCVSNKFESSQLIYNELELTEKNVVAYSALDIREEQFGDKMLSSFKEQLISRFDKYGVKTTVLNYNDSEVGTAPYVSGKMSGSVSFSMDKFISQYQNLEVKNSADYRLSIIPSKMTISGSLIDFDITWLLIDAKSNLLVWKGVSKGTHNVMFSANEMPEMRALLLVDSLFSELNGSNIFGQQNL
ncbi:MAG: hypothetical protein KUG81_01970 [Gammaproteobacteria bacterium]|nr:hypothetical protein [Gammaproteobacteria bacterium]